MLGEANLNQPVVVPGVLVPVWIGDDDDVPVKVPRHHALLSFSSLRQPVHEIGGGGGGDPLAGVDAGLKEQDMSGCRWRCRA